MTDQYQQNKDTPSEEKHHHTDKIPHKLLTIHLKSHPIIWDSSHEHNAKTSLKEAAWNEIAQKCHPFSKKQLKKEYMRCRNLCRKRREVGRKSRCTLDLTLWNFLDKDFQRKHEPPNKHTPFNSSAATDIKVINTEEETQVNENLRKKYYYGRTTDSEKNTHSDDCCKTPVKEMSHPETEVKSKRPATDPSKFLKRRKVGVEEVNVNKGSQSPRTSSLIIDLTNEDSLIIGCVGNELGSYVKEETNKEDSKNKGLIKDLVPIQKKSISDVEQENICFEEDEDNNWDNFNDSYDDEKLDYKDELIVKDNSSNSTNDLLGAVTNQINLSSSEMNNSLQNQCTEEEEKSPRPVTQNMEETPFAKFNNQTHGLRCSSNNYLQNEGKEKPRIGAHHSADKREYIRVFTKDMTDTPLSKVINQTRMSRSPSNNGLRNHIDKGPRFVAHHSTEEKNCPPRTTQDTANTSLAKVTSQTYLPHSQSNDHFQYQCTEEPRLGEDYSKEEKNCQPRTTQDTANTSLDKVTSQTHFPHSQSNDHFQYQCTEEPRLGEDHSKEEKNCPPRTTQDTANTSLAKVTSQAHLPHSQSNDHFQYQCTEEPRLGEDRSKEEKNCQPRTTQDTSNTSLAKVTSQTHLPHSQSSDHFQFKCTEEPRFGEDQSKEEKNCQPRTTQEILETDLAKVTNQTHLPHSQPKEHLKNQDAEEPKCAEHYCAGEKNYPSRTTENTADTSYAKVTNQTHLPHSQSECHLQNKVTEDPSCVEHHSDGDKNYIGETTQDIADTHLVTVPTQLQPSQPYMNEQRAKAEEAIPESVEHLWASASSFYLTDGETSKKNLIPLAQNSETKHPHHPTDVPLEGDNIANFRDFSKNSLDQHIKSFNDLELAQFKSGVLGLLIGFLDTKARKQ